MMKKVEEIPESGDAAAADGNQAFRHDIINKKEILEELYSKIMDLLPKIKSIGDPNMEKLKIVFQDEIDTVDLILMDLNDVDEDLKNVLSSIQNIRFDLNKTLQNVQIPAVYRYYLDAICDQAEEISEMAEEFTEKMSVSRYQIQEKFHELCKEFEPAFQRLEKLLNPIISSEPSLPMTDSEKRLIQRVQNEFEELKYAMNSNFAVEEIDQHFPQFRKDFDNRIETIQNIINSTETTTINEQLLLFTLPDDIIRAIFGFLTMRSILQFDVALTSRKYRNNWLQVFNFNVCPKYYCVKTFPHLTKSAVESFMQVNNEMMIVTHQGCSINLINLKTNIVKDTFMMKQGIPLHDGRIASLSLGDIEIFNLNSQETEKFSCRKDDGKPQYIEQFIYLLHSNQFVTVMSSTVQIWDLIGHKCRQILTGFDCHIVTLLELMDNLLMISLIDGRVEIWNLEKNERQLTLGPFPNEVRKLIKLDKERITFQFEDKFLIYYLLQQITSEIIDGIYQFELSFNQFIVKKFPSYLNLCEINEKGKYINTLLRQDRKMMTLQVEKISSSRIILVRQEFIEIFNVERKRVEMQRNARTTLTTLFIKRCGILFPNNKELIVGFDSGLIQIWKQIENSKDESIVLIEQMKNYEKLRIDRLNKLKKRIENYRKSEFKRYQFTLEGLEFLGFKNDGNNSKEEDNPKEIRLNKRRELMKPFRYCPAPPLLFDSFFHLNNRQPNVYHHGGIFLIRKMTIFTDLEQLSSRYGEEMIPIRKLKDSYLLPRCPMKDISFQNFLKEEIFASIHRNTKIPYFYLQVNLENYLSNLFRDGMIPFSAPFHLMSKNSPFLLFSKEELFSGPSLLMGVKGLKTSFHRDSCYDYAQRFEEEKKRIVRNRQFIARQVQQQSPIWSSSSLFGQFLPSSSARRPSSSSLSISSLQNVEFRNPGKWNLFLQVTGKRRFSLFPPEESDALVSSLLSSSSSSSSSSSTSSWGQGFFGMIQQQGEDPVITRDELLSQLTRWIHSIPRDRSEKEQLEFIRSSAFPSISSIWSNRREYFLDEGDLLLIPAGWWYCSEILVTGIALNWSFHTPLEEKSFQQQCDQLDEEDIPTE